MDFTIQSHQPSEGDSFRDESFPPRGDVVREYFPTGVRGGGVSRALPEPDGIAPVISGRRKESDGEPKPPETPLVGALGGGGRTTPGAEPKKPAALKFPVRWEDLPFSSKSEAICGKMLEKYIPGFKLIPGETFQIPVGTKKIDFRINGVFVEFHPVQIRHEFTSKSAYDKFQAAMGRLTTWESQSIESILMEEFSGQYTKGRRLILNCFEGTKNAELVVCANRAEFVKNVLRRFGGPGTPSESKLLREFDKLFRETKKQFTHVESE